MGVDDLDKCLNYSPIRLGLHNIACKILQSGMDMSMSDGAKSRDYN